MKTSRQHFIYSVSLYSMVQCLSIHTIFRTSRVMYNLLVPSSMSIVLALLLFINMTIYDDKLENIFIETTTSSFLLPAAFGHGLGVDRISSVHIGDQTINITVEMPQEFTGSDTEQITITATDSITDKGINDITYLLGITHNNKTIFRDYFYAKNDVLSLDIETTTMSNDPKIIGMQDGSLNAWQPLLLQQEGNANSIRINDSAFGASGLYTFDIAVYGLGQMPITSDPVTHYADLSVIESATSFQTSSDGSMVSFGTKSYFDNVEDITYDAQNGKVVLVMPFDWRESRMSHIPVVHVETHFPKDFLEFNSLGYEGFVNGIKLFKSSLVIDDYTLSDQRTIHFILLQDHIRFLKNEMKKTGEPFPDTMTFEIKMVDKVDFPLVAYTISEDFLVNLSWDPLEIEPNEEITFVFTIRDGTTGEPLRNSDYTFVIEQNGQEIFKKTDRAQIGGQFIKFTFGEDQTGPTSIKFENIRGTGQETEFGILVVPEFGYIVIFVLAGATAMILVLSRLCNNMSTCFISHTRT